MDGATLGGRVFPQDESPGTTRLGGESLLPMVMKTSGLDISMVGGPLPVPSGFPLLSASERNLRPGRKIVLPLDTCQWDRYTLPLRFLSDSPGGVGRTPVPSWASVCC